MKPNTSSTQIPGRGAVLECHIYIPFAEGPLRHITDCMTDLFAEESA